METGEGTGVEWTPVSCAVRNVNRDKVRGVFLSKREFVVRVNVILRMWPLNLSA